MDSCYNIINHNIQYCLQLEKEQKEQKIAEDLNGLVIEPKPKKKSQREVFFLPKKK